MKKKLLSLALALVMCLGLCVPASAAGGFTIQNGVLAKYNGSGGAVTIPGGVTTIGESAFEGCAGVTGVTIPNGVTEIGNKAFRDCSNMTSVTIPASVTRLGERAFMRTGLTGVTIPGSVGTIEFCAFCGCENLTSVTIQDGVTGIGDSVFESCGSLKSVTIPASVTSIESLAFLECGNLTDIYYGGSETQWNAIKCDYMDFRDELTNVTIHYNSGSVPAQPAAGGFTDVAAGSPYAEAIAWAVEQGITNGTSPTTFSPAATCTTRQILTFLYRANGRPGAAAGQNDLDAAVSWAASQGILPDGADSAIACTRAAAVQYIWKAAGSPAPKSAASFSDVAADADYARAVSWAVEKGITNGTGADTFSPDNTCTRGQIVTFLYRNK